MRVINLATVNEVLNNHGIKTKTRKREIVWRRYAAFNFLRNNSRLSLGEIGKLCGGKDHATVLHGLREYNRQLRYEDFRYHVSEIENHLYNAIEPDTEFMCTGEKEVFCLVELERMISKLL